VTDLISRQAEWSEESANYEAAVEMYLKARRYDRALDLMTKHGWWDRLHALVRQLSRDQDGKLLAQCAAALKKAGQYGAAKEALLKLEDVGGLVELGVQAERWEDASLMAAAHPELAPRVHLPHARWLCARDRWALAFWGAGACTHARMHSLFSPKTTLPTN
jgi:intraflagellar transport protein 122